MKVLGIDQFHKKKFKFLGFKDEWLFFIGNLALNFIGIIYGKSGQGKTEFCIRLAKYLCKFGRVAWLSYEQGHDFDFQMASIRNNMQEEAGKFLPIDPLQKRQKGKTKFQELDDYLSKRSTPEFVFIDSLDYLDITPEEYYYLKEKYGGKKGIIFLSHEKNGAPESKVGQKIEYDGKFSVRVFKYIARKMKNRVGGSGNYVVYFKEARRVDPLFFKKAEQEMEVVHNWHDEAIEQQRELEMQKKN
ncbi:hypothetical protein CJD36_019970 [Flavipsychrobacter stenotrophus]|uniref:AAA+ ATPase domain-containing protein n=1 Tax=Flavipsychrobacter stenotrophus TaxID=2077091 RepID=A0A2S7SS23_9BACT|nr:hypothetical protein [Flavipsychrobacter stenotrophus]PQJ09518.1 hypothetical protein CJD36_019970 [Flavipsychrobacter stenotrophus]